MLVTRAVIALSVGDPKVLLAAIDELLTKLSFELRVSPVLLGLCCHVVPVLDLVFFGLSKAIKVCLETACLLHSTEAQ